MRNPFLPPEAVQRYLKIAVKGRPGSGKTFFGLLARKYALGPVYIASSEGGDLFYLDDEEVKPDGRLQTQNIGKLEEGIDFLERNPGVCGTLVIDTATGIYEALVTAKMTDNGDMRMDQWAPIKRKFKELMTRMVNLPCNLVWVVHVNDVVEQNGMKSEVVGTKADVEKTFMRNPDVVIELAQDVKRKPARWATVEKDRTRTYQAGQVVSDPNIGLWAKAIRKEGKVEAQLTPDQLKTENAAAMESDEQKKYAELVAEIAAGFKDAAAAAAFGTANKAVIQSMSKDRAAELRKLYKAALEKATPQESEAA